MPPKQKNGGARRRETVAHVVPDTPSMLGPSGKRANRRPSRAGRRASSSASDRQHHLADGHSLFLPPKITGIQRYRPTGTAVHPDQTVDPGAATVVPITRVHGPQTTQRELYEVDILPRIQGVALKGDGRTLNILVHGDPGAGKTYTCVGGEDLDDPARRGLLPRIVADVFTHVFGESQTRGASPRPQDDTVQVRSMYISRKEGAHCLHDLLTLDQDSLNLVDGVVHGISTVEAKNTQEAMGLFYSCDSNRAYLEQSAQTGHAVYIVEIFGGKHTAVPEQQGTHVYPQIWKVKGRVVLVDLAPGPLQVGKHDLGTDDLITLGARLRSLCTETQTEHRIPKPGTYPLVSILDKTIGGQNNETVLLGCHALGDSHADTKATTPPTARQSVLETTAVETVPAVATAASNDTINMLHDIIRQLEDQKNQLASAMRAERKMRQEENAMMQEAVEELIDSQTNMDAENEELKATIIALQDQHERERAEQLKQDQTLHARVARMVETHKEVTERYEQKLRDVDRAYLTKTQDRPRIIVSRVVRRIENKSTFAALQKWKAYMHSTYYKNEIDMLKADMAAQDERRRQKEQRWFARRILARMANHAITLAMDTWRDHTRKHRLLATLATRMQHHDLARSFDGWVHAVHNSVQQREHMCRVLLRIEHKLSFAAWRKWQAFTVTTRFRNELEMLKEQMAQEEEARRCKEKAHMIEHALRRFKHHSLAAALDAWREHLRLSRLVERASKRLQHRGLAKSLCQWAHVTHTHKSQRKTMSRVVMRALHRRAATALRKWVDVSTHDWRIQQKGAHQRRQARMLVQRMQHRGMTKAWCQWVDTVHGHKRQRELVKRVITRLQRKHSFTAWSTWQKYVAERQHAKEIDALKAQISHHEKARQGASMRHVLLRGMRGRTQSGFQVWYQHTQQCLRAEQTARWMRRHTRRHVITQWRRGVKRQKRRRRLIQCAVSSIAIKQLAVAFRNWNGYAIAMRNDADQKCRDREIQTRVQVMVDQHDAVVAQLTQRIEQCARDAARVGAEHCETIAALKHEMQRAESDAHSRFQAQQMAHEHAKRTLTGRLSDVESRASRESKLRQDRIDMFEAQCAASKETVAEAELRISALQKEQDALCRQLETLQGTVTDQTGTIREQQVEKSSFEMDRRAWQRERDTLAQEISMLTKDKTSSEEFVGLLERNVEDLQRRKADTEAQLAKQQIQIHEQENSLRQLRLANKEQSEKIRLMKNALDTYQTTMDDVDRNTKTMKQEFETVLAQKKEEVSQLSRKSKAHVVSAERERKMLEETQAQLTSTQQRLDELVADHATEMKTLARNYKHSTSHYDELIRRSNEEKEVLRRDHENQLRQHKKQFDEIVQGQEEVFRQEIAQLQSEWKTNTMKSQQEARKQWEKEAKEEYEFSIMQVRTDAERNLKVAVELARAEERETFAKRQQDEEKTQHIALIALRARLQDQFDAEQAMQLDIHRGEMTRMRDALDNISKKRRAKWVRSNTSKTSAPAVDQVTTE